MQRNLRQSIIIGLSAFFMSSSVFAVMSVPYGWYVEGNLGSSRLTNKHYPSGVKTSSSGIGANANLGYKFMPYAAAEGGYTSYPNTSIKASSGTKVAIDKRHNFHLAAKAILPIVDSGFEVFAKLGLNRIYDHTSVQDATAASAVGIASGNHSATGLYLGVGGQYNIWPELALNLQWQRANGSNSTGSEELLSAGLTFIIT